MPKTIRMYDIEWDTDKPIDDDTPDDTWYPILPSEHTVEVNRHWDANADGAELLSDEFRFRVKRFSWEEVAK